ncbi:MAG: primosomal protein N' [Dehalococcoidales bacterium]|nr:primosomal protein N' [Dehalococcoidales bacterium]
MYAEVSVNSPIAQRRAFTYAIPSDLNIAVGQAVWVPFGEKVLQGIVLALSPTSSIETKEILGLIEPQPVLSPARAELARWISEYYISPLFDAVALFLPPGFERKAVTLIQPTGKSLDELSLSQEQKEAFASVLESGKIELKTLEKTAGKKNAQAIVSRMVKLGLLTRSYTMEAVKAKPKIATYMGLAVPADIAQQEAIRLRARRAEKQASLLDYLASQPGPVSLADARAKADGDKSTAEALARKGLVKLQQLEVKRTPTAYQNIAPTSPLKLTDAQENAFGAIRDALSEPKGQVFLLHGVTGSGKTEVYLQALREAVRLGKRGIVLVPEISLTPQTIERFAGRFPNRVAVLHSQLSLGEQFDEWQRIRNGEADVVIGPRSAVFAPQPDLGLIVIDEEQEWTYKQSDKSPRYHTRSVALKLAELTGAVVVMGSATPDVETFYHAQRGDYRLLQLPERVVPNQGAPLPQVEVVDMKQELKAGNRSIFSRSLSQLTTQAVNKGEQVILFLNRRGAASFIQCRSCGHVLRCKRCDVALAYHAAENILTCHHCNYRTRVPGFCPRCSTGQLRYMGVGTQKLEQEAGYAFPAARQMRWDSDVTRKQSHEAILNKFRNHEADILIGTQMVAKGLDLPLVTVVGVISADTSLNLPDFRSGERSFQLLSQVAGRAGRGIAGGRVVVQTFAPEHYAIQAAARHDYASFYAREIEYRRQLQYPPFTQLALLVYTHTNNVRCQKEAERVRDMLLGESQTRGLSLSLIGPAPAFVHKLRGRFRWQLIVRGAGLSAFLSPLTFPTGWTIDIDPVTVV